MASAAPEIPLLPRDEAFENLYRRYVQDVYHYSLALLRNPADAEDVTQTTFMNAYRAYQRGEEVQKPHNWLIKIAHNVARSRYARSSRRVKEVPLDDHAEQLATPEAERPDVDGVLRALGRLPFNQRAALIMRELEGRSYIEIADTLGVSVAAVETLIFRARRALRVRTAALRSILAVPLPSSLTQLFEGGGAAVSGVGAGFIVKAAIAIVAGAVATGVGSDSGSNRAVAAPKSQARHAPTQQVAAKRPAAKYAGVGKEPSRMTGRNAARGSRAAGRTSTPNVQAQVAPAVVHQPSAASGPLAPPSLSATQPVTNTVANTTNTVAGTVDHTVNSVTAAVPTVTVSVGPVSVQTPPLPKLP